MIIMTEKKEIRSLLYEELAAELGEMGLPAYRTGQVWQWVHEKQAASFAEMSNLSLALRGQLEERFDLAPIEPVKKLISAVDGTRKYLFRLRDGNMIESVLMRYRYGNSVCVSSQAGCRMGCRFCASALGGLARSLTPGEMLDQVYRIQKDSGERVSHVVVMGSGEPLDNYGNLLRFLKILTDGRGIRIGQRNVTVSTCGLVPEMKRLAEEKLQITLALSLHAADDATRRSLMPVAARYPLAEVMDACRLYFEKTGRRMTFEYSLVRGVNDSPADADRLARLLRDMRGHVNLIPVNPVRERNFARPDRGAVEAFKNRLEKNGINVTIRRETGRDINGACGQLRRSAEAVPPDGNAR